MAIAEKPKVTQLQDELEVIRQSAGGILYPWDVVEYAKNPDTTLHTQFEWDDTEAGHKYRVWQARQIIRAVVTITPTDGQTIEAYVSLKSDRYEDGGYRAITEVLSDKEYYKQLLADALSDLELWERKYQQLNELKPIFKAAKQLREKV